MQTEELVYTGVIRTPLMALTQKIKFKNSMTSVAAEYFATTADVYRLTGDLQMTDDMADTADGQDKSDLASARRIARMIGHDVEDAAFADWVELAQGFKQQQLMRLSAVASMHISRVPIAGLDNNHSLSEILMVGAGAGCFLMKEIASSMNIQYVDVSQLIGENLNYVDHTQLANLKDTTHWTTVCLPAVAVAHLVLNEDKIIVN
jgi:probable H4MPT-linked C1 transfer pathway protein